MEDKVDLTGISLLIATPMMSGQPQDEYCSSLDRTKQLIRLHGGQVEQFKTKYVSDIAYARSKLFGAFLRNKQYTHVLMIDDDMGWDAEQVVWFLLLKRDFIAAAGPKKKFPIEYAYNLVGDNGKIQPLYHELETNVAEIPFVGGAFVMLSRDCVERMASAYPELQYEVDPGVKEYAVFDPIIIPPNRRLAEDYAFCWRWRKIGGKVEVKMDCSLTHTGSHTFTGNLYDHLCKTEPSFNATVNQGSGKITLIDGSLPKVT